MDGSIPLLGALKVEAHHGELCVQNRGRRNPLRGNGKRVGSCDQVRPRFDLVDWIPRKLVKGTLSSLRSTRAVVRQRLSPRLTAT
jgi:hypothetical protein